MIDQKFQKNDTEQRGGVLGNTPLSREFNNKFESSICFDYLSFTFPFSFKEHYSSFNTSATPEDKELITMFFNILILKPNEAEILNYGTKGFQYGLKWQVPVQFVGESKPATRLDYWLRLNDLQLGCFELTGACCRDFERRCANKGLDADEVYLKLFDFIFNCGGSISRIDIAYDFFNVKKEDPFLYFYNKIINCEFNSPIQKINPDFCFCDNGDYRTYTKQVIHLGSINGNVSAEIYNKKLQQEALKKEVDVNSWIRFEIKLKDTKADSIVAHLISCWNNKENYLTEILKYYFNFKVRPKSNNDYFVKNTTRRKWKTDPFWDEITGENIGRQKIVNMFLKETTITAKAFYIKNEYKKFLATLYYAYGPSGFELILKETIKDGSFDVLEANTLSLINFHRHENKLDQIDDSQILETQDVLKQSLETSKDDIYSVTEDGEIFKTNEDILIPLKIDKSKQKKSALSEINKYKNTKEFRFFISALKKELGTDFDELDPETLIEKINQLIKEAKELK